MIALRLAAIEPLASSLKRLTLEPMDGGPLPAAAPGAHLVLSIAGPERTWRNAYSITNPGRRDRYELIVRWVGASRGGSRFLHMAAREGDILQAPAPANLFPLSKTARRHLLIGGGVGLTPLLAQAAALKAAGQAFELHQVCAKDEAPMFERLLQPLHGVVHPGRASLDIAAVLERQPLGTQLHVCGPEGLMQGVTETAAVIGWPARAVHRESFGTASGGEPFTAVLARSGRELQVAGDQSLLEALEAAGIDAPSQCRGGACGRCLAPLLEGEADHRDHVLTDEERAGGKLILPCVSRARSKRLVLDL